MIVGFDPVAWDAHVYWQTHDKTIVRKLNALIKECLRHPFDGTGKPEPLLGNLSGFRSRRLSREHRLVYRAAKGVLQIAQCRYHY
ncbi:MAG: Txe/YoeB family addiction module toxin [Paracoccaceae bacterium]